MKKTIQKSRDDLTQAFSIFATLPIDRMIDTEKLLSHFAAVCRQQLLANSNALQKRDVAKMDDRTVVWLATNQIASFAGGRVDPAYDRLVRNAKRARDTANRKRRAARRRAKAT